MYKKQEDIPGFDLIQCCYNCENFESLEENSGKCHLVSSKKEDDYIVFIDNICNKWSEE